ncbi:hypothetical protein ASE01_08230 [Nocardioides sp. Root190]|uniref:PspC domain-containing protein n=1 Tax=Nocardioides sp. Root190 TaxID=1736488 RepID=UPI0006FD38E4|nr:PspC domain-containing protein [Nocardioides sp. Root190]KRB78132.1 hypothetical protein ASE01_08230 [Nocardioides sp. Root190]
MSSPYDTDSGPTGPEQGPSTPSGPPSAGPRVSRDEVRDLAALRRSRTDRKVSGVAGGVARHLDIDPLLVRVAFVILTFFGGGGLILYGVAWILVPEEDTGDTVIHTEDGVRTAALIIAGVLAAASVIGDSVGGMDVPWPLMVVGLVMIVVLGGKQAKDRRFGGSGAADGLAPDAGADGPTYPGYRPGPPPPPRPAEPRRRGPLLFPFTLALAAFGLGVVGTLHLAGVDVAVSAYPATALGVIGLMLLVGAFYGRAGGLIFIGLLAAIATAVTSVVDDVEMGEINKKPDTAAELKTSYSLGIGEIVIDLTGLDATELAQLDGDRLEVDLDVGHLRIVVPDEGLRVNADASIELGEVILFGEKSDSSDRASHGDAEDPVLEIDADLSLGQLEIITAKDAA